MRIYESDDENKYENNKENKNEKRINLIITR